MQIKLYPVFLLLCLILGINTAYSQKSPAKFGKITKEHLEATSCPIDEDAHAYYIFDYGKVYFDYADTKQSSRSTEGSSKGFERLLKKHFRIKILDNQAFDLANIEIPLYRDEEEDKISGLKAYTYNLENGKIVKTKFNKKDVKKEETSQYWLTAKFALPNVKVGSVIEVEYTVRSFYFFDLPTWYFQHTIPTLKSDYNVHIPEYYKYASRETGYYPITKSEEFKSREVTITYVERNDFVSGSGGAVDKSTNTTRYRDKVFLHKAENVPAFPKEKYLKTSLNYISKIDFELENVKFPSQDGKSYSTTWQKVDQTMAERYTILKKNKHLNASVAALTQSKKSGLNVIKLAFENIQKHFVWNGIRYKYPKTTLKKAYENKTGNCADINLNLVMLLRELGFESNPVLLSTQKHGIIQENDPSLSAFDYVIGMVKLEDKVYLLDATDPTSEVNLLPVRCLNGKGRMMGQGDEKWIDLMNRNAYKSTSHYELALGDDLTIKGKGKETLKGYAAYLKRIRIKEENANTHSANNEDEQDKNANLIIENLTGTGIETLGTDVELAYEIMQKDYAEKNADLIYFSPALDSYFKKNPFKLEKREFPVEFDYPYNIQQMYSITIPDGYQVHELPKPLITQMPDKSIKFIYQVSQVGNKINVMSMLNIKKNLFLPEEYQGLKQVFQMMADKQKEFVVLKKKS